MAILIKSSLHEDDIKAYYKEDGYYWRTWSAAKAFDGTTIGMDCMNLKFDTDIGEVGGYYILEYCKSAPLSWLVPFFVFYVLILVAAVVMVAAGFVRQICIFKIYESTVPEKAVKYLLLSLMVPLAGPICLFKCRNKGYGEETSEMVLQRLIQERNTND